MTPYTFLTQTSIAYNVIKYDAQILVYIVSVNYFLKEREICSVSYIRNMMR